MSKMKPRKDPSVPSKREPVARKKWNELVEEAAVPDFELVVDDDRSIFISQPTGEQVEEAIELVQTGGSMLDQVRILCGDAAEEVMDLARKAPGPAITNLLDLLAEHFKFDMDDSGEARSRT